MFKERKVDASIQRSSITDVIYAKNKAARIIQRAVRRFLQQKNAVATIEKWWFPHAIEKIEREVFEKKIIFNCRHCK